MLDSLAENLGGLPLRAAFQQARALLYVPGRPGFIDAFGDGGVLGRHGSQNGLALVFLPFGNQLWPLDKSGHAVIRPFFHLPAPLGRANRQIGALALRRRQTARCDPLCLIYQRLAGRGQLPNAYSGRPVAGNEAPPVHRQRQSIDAANVALKLDKFLARLGVPDAYRAIARGCDDAAAVRRHHDTGDGAGVALELDEFLASAGIPDAGRPVIGGGDNAGPVRRQCDVDDAARVTLEPTHLVFPFLRPRCARYHHPRP